jgi:nucleoside-diphosphate-sugar epimerase
VGPVRGLGGRVRVVVVGGTGFVGRAIVRALEGAKHNVTLVHRGVQEVDDERGTAVHLHVDRKDLSGSWRRLPGTPDVLVDVAAYTREDARQVLNATRSDSKIRLVVLSSMDVYAVWASFRSSGTGSPVKLDETAPLRESRYIYRGQPGADDDYEKLDVEEEYSARGATVLRLPMVYGEHDGQRRENFILRRCRAGRKRIPMGPGRLKWSKGYVGDVAQAVRLAVEEDSSVGDVFNVCEQKTWSMREWAERIQQASSCTAELAQVADERLPSDMGLTGTFRGDLLFDASKLRESLGWEESDRGEALRRSVSWHLSNPPDENGDFTEDDHALGGT